MVRRWYYRGPLSEPVPTAELSAEASAADIIHRASDLDDVRETAEQVLIELIPCDTVSFHWVAPGALFTTMYPRPP